MSQKKKTDGFEYKICPRCKDVLFSDMKICYNCMYNFDEDEQKPLDLRDTSDDEQNPVFTNLNDTLQNNDHAFAPKPGFYLKSATVGVKVFAGENGITVGSDASCDVVLNSPAVSARHVFLYPTPQGMEVHNLGALYPVRYQGREIENKLLVPYGETVEVCGTMLHMSGPQTKDLYPVSHYPDDKYF